MLPIGLLMKEHRLIERMITLISKQLDEVKQGKNPDTLFIDQAVDFIRTYADHCHHGKEEDILFRDLAQKDLSPGHKTVMQELIQEHVWGRETVGQLVEAKKRFEKGDGDARVTIRECLEKLVEFYPKHIDKEDHHFFKPAMDYFSDQEKNNMIKECFEFDQGLIHDKYQSLVHNLEDQS